jgi:hypothetical protein
MWLISLCIIMYIVYSAAFDNAVYDRSYVMCE